MLDSHQLCLVQNIPSPPEWIRTPRELSLSSLPSLHSLATSKLRSVSMDLSILDVSCKRHRNLCTAGVWHLSRSTGVWVHRVVICTNTPFIFTLCNIPPWAGVLCNLSLQPSVDGHLGYFYLWIIVLLPSQVLSSTVHRPPPPPYPELSLFFTVYLPEDTRDAGWIPGSGRSPGGGNGSPLQNSCQEKFMDRGVWQATICGVAKVRHDCAHSHTPLWEDAH